MCGHTNHVWRRCTGCGCHGKHVWLLWQTRVVAMANVLLPQMRMRGIFKMTCCCTSKLARLFYLFYEGATRWIIRVWGRQVSSLLLSYIETVESWDENYTPTKHIPRVLPLSKPRGSCVVVLCCMLFCSALIVHYARDCSCTYCTVVIGPHIYIHG